MSEKTMTMELSEYQLTLLVMGVAALDTLAKSRIEQARAEGEDAIVPIIEAQMEGLPALMDKLQKGLEALP